VFDQHPMSDDDTEAPEPVAVLRRDMLIPKHPTPPVEDMVSPRGKALVSLAKARAEAIRLIELLDATERNLLHGARPSLCAKLAEDAAQSSLSATISLGAYARRMERGQ